MTMQTMLDDVAGAACKVDYDAGNMNAARDCYNASLGRGVVGSDVFWEFLTERGILGELQVAADAGNDDAITVLEFARHPGQDNVIDVDLDLPRMVTRIDALVTATVITTAQKNQINALGDGQGSLAITHLGRPVRKGELGQYKLENP